MFLTTWKSLKEYDSANWLDFKSKVCYNVAILSFVSFLFHTDITVLFWTKDLPTQNIIGSDESSHFQLFFVCFYVVLLLDCLRICWGLGTHSSTCSTTQHYISQEPVTLCLSFAAVGYICCFFQLLFCHKSYLCFFVWIFHILLCWCPS